MCICAELFSQVPAELSELRYSPYEVIYNPASVENPELSDGLGLSDDPEIESADPMIDAEPVEFGEVPGMIGPNNNL